MQLQPDDRRQLNKIKDIGASALRNVSKLERLNTVISQMETIYTEATPCLTDGKCRHLDPGLTKVMATSDDYAMLLSAWKGWRDLTGKKMKNLYTEYVALKNEGVKELNMPDYGAYWRSWYNTDDPGYDFKDDVYQLFRTIQPLYEQLHAYVRRFLRNKFGKEHPFPATGHIPAHLLGNMWAQTWDTFYSDLAPFKNKQTIDITAVMAQRNYTVHKIFKTAEDFFTSIGFPKMTQTFWDKSMFVKPEDGRQVVCHGSAEDFYKKDDFRIKMCTVITQEDFNTVHHEMGHIEYFMLYSPLPQVYRDSANPGFHEAVGDLMTLSVQTPEHLHRVGLLDNLVSDNETDLNFQMNMALQKLAFLPFGYLVDQWRWGVFSGQTPPENYNQDWWNLRCRLQGISSPVDRSPDDFDPGAKYHIPADVPYVRYFVSFIVQFQFHKAACDKAGYTGPLHHCDIYNNKRAGAALREMLELGASKPWPDALEKLTGSRKLSAAALMEYFKPLYEFLKKENGNDYGWNPICPQQLPKPVVG